jgi:hypothetical protein
VVQGGWLPGRCRRGAPSFQALVVQVIQERGQEPSGGRQPGIEVPLELLGRLLAFRPCDLVEYLVEIARPHLATLLG